MVRKKCDEPDCFTNNKDKLEFCAECTDILVNQLSVEELYDVYYTTTVKLNKLINGEDSEESASALLCKDKLYKCINKIMLLRIKREGSDSIDWPD